MASRLFSKFTTSNAAKEFRIRIADPSNSGLALRFMPSAFAADAFKDKTNTLVSSTANVDDKSVIDKIIQSDPNFVTQSTYPRLTPLVVSSGSNSTWTLDPYLFWDQANVNVGVNLNPYSENSDIARMMLMFEGIHPGAGSVYFDFLDAQGQTLSYAKIGVAIHPLKELYDHYSVSYGSNVDPSTFTFTGNGVAPLDSLHPVPATSMLISENKERDRSKTQSNDYIPLRARLEHV